jgi:hypothetical protein
VLTPLTLGVLGWEIHNVIVDFKENQVEAKMVGKIKNQQPVFLDRPAPQPGDDSEFRKTYHANLVESRVAAAMMKSEIKEENTQICEQAFTAYYGNLNEESARQALMIIHAYCPSASRK